jgi:DNA polymerase epsilon subunit 2
MMLLVEGVYIEEGSGSSTSEASLGTMGGVGATIGGRFVVGLVAHPPGERRATTLSIRESEDETPPPEAFGWTDFLGVGSSKATGPKMRKLMNRILSSPDVPRQNSTQVAIVSEVCLDRPATLSALRKLFSHYDSQPKGSIPLAMVLMGNFCSAPALAGTSAGSSVAYKEAFNSLASVMSEFPALVARTTWVFVPGDDDAYPSAFGAGGAVPLPRRAVPEIFTGRVRRVVAESNRELRLREKDNTAKNKEAEVIWASNPSRLTWFGVSGEMVLFRDDVTGRMRRTSIRFPKSEDTELEDASVQEAQHSDEALDPDTHFARRLTMTMLDQAHLSPFPQHLRPVHWDHALSSMQLYPLPNALVMADAEAPAFAVTYKGCTVMNPGRLVEGRRDEKCCWVEYDVLSKRAEVRMLG